MRADDAVETLPDFVFSVMRVRAMLRRYVTLIRRYFSLRYVFATLLPLTAMMLSPLLFARRRYAAADYTPAFRRRYADASLLMLRCRFR